MGIYKDIINATYSKHKGHKLSKFYVIDGYIDFRIRICEDCNLALLYNPDDADL